MPKRKNKKRNRLLDLLVYLGVRSFSMFVHMVPLAVSYRLAGLLGEGLYRFDRKHRRIARQHLRLSFPKWSETKIRRTVRASMRHMVYLPLEMMFTTRRVRPATWRKYIRLANMSENLRLLLERRTGMIFLTGHFGNWEIVGFSMAALGFPNTAIARRLDNPYLDRHLLGIREHRGMTILDKRGATTVAPGLLDQKGAVSFIADQDAGRKGMFVDFFGRQASTYKAIGLLAMQHQVPVVVGYGLRLGETFRFEIGIQRIIHPHEWADQDDPLRFITQQYTSALQQAIQRAPEQYLWVHRRWKHRPRGEEPGPNGVA